jgi:hypothetical protein
MSTTKSRGWTPDRREKGPKGGSRRNMEMPDAGTIFAEAGTRASRRTVTIGRTLNLVTQVISAFECVRRDETDMSAIAGAKNRSNLRPYGTDSADESQAVTMRSLGISPRLQSLDFLEKTRERCAHHPVFAQGISGSLPHTERGNREGRDLTIC